MNFSLVFLYYYKPITFNRVTYFRPTNCRDTQVLGDKNLYCGGKRQMRRALKQHDSWIKEWKEECLKWRGIVLKGHYTHYCFEYDGLPMDETCLMEWPCGCFKER